MGRLRKQSKKEQVKVMNIVDEILKKIKIAKTKKCISNDEKDFLNSNNDTLKKFKKKYLESVIKASKG
jgi:ribosome recycling factor